MFIVDWLSGSGHRLSTGEPNSSGTVRVLLPGMNTEAVIFDANGETLTQPVELDAAGKADIYVDGPVDLVFEDFSGAAVQTVPYGNIHGADGVLVESAAFTGTLPSGSEGAGGRTYLDAVLDTALASFGGTDFQFQESASAVPMPVSTWMSGVHLNVKGFGAKGDNLQVDTSFIQLALNRAAALGGGTVYFPPGTYLIDAALNVPISVSLVGASPTISVIKCTNATQNGLVLSSAGRTLIQRMTISHSSTSTGIGISCTSSGTITIREIIISGVFATAVKFDACSATAIYDSQLTCFDGGGGTGRCILYTTSGNGHFVCNTTLTGGTGRCIETDTSTNQYAFVGLSFNSGAAGIRLTSSSATTGTTRVIGCLFFAGVLANAFEEASSPHSRALFQIGNGVDSESQSVAIGGNLTPHPILKGRICRLTSSSGGAGTVTINALTTNPLQVGFQMVMELESASGGNTTFALNAMYHTTGAVVVTNGHITSIVFEWDGTVMRERSRADTT